MYDTSAWVHQYHPHSQVPSDARDSEFYFIFLIYILNRSTYSPTCVHTIFILRKLSPLLTNIISKMWFAELSKQMCHVLIIFFKFMCYPSISHSQQKTGLRSPMVFLYPKNDFYLYMYTQSSSPIICW